MSAETISETLQENADMMRVLKAGLRTHDPETVDSAFLRIVKKYGENIATNCSNGYYNFNDKQGKLELV